MSFCLLVPVKSLDTAKSRLVTPASDRRELMRAFVADALEAALASPAVHHLYVVTDEQGLGPSGTRTLPDGGGGDLNAALRHAERTVRLRHPDLGVAAMCGDLPALRTDDLTTALTGSTAPRWYVADTAGTGTTLLAAGPGVHLDPHFGPDSAHLHEQSGARPVRAEVASLRHDVDTEADLRAAIELGLGRLTRAAMGRHAGE
ncbi:2-phospho-L-lactate guanylyltransferase [Nocardioides aequoreus]|uniref:2-phospho-L-lactate guanylyltransferase n=1 Tax=Nocardioides aequoreus TaxID=397278 RepID=UPI0004C3BBE4|nr:2-phospho-L-lactate guanylyltransferase [Nocardioides aequoreus]